MYIKQLKIKDFQSHVDTSLEFSKGFNCIIGSTDSGKTSIIRALKFILFGEPWKNTFVNYDSDECKIGIKFDNDIKLIRSKGKGINEYILNDKKYESFGVNIPTEIKRTINIDTIKIDDNKEINLNFSDQLNSMFLIDEPGSVKAKILNKLSGIDIIDKVLKSLNDDKRELSSKRKFLKQRLESIEEDLKNYVDIEKKKEKLNLIKIEIEDLKCSEKRLTELTVLYTEIDSWKNEKKKLEKLENELKELEKINIDEIINKLDKIEKENSELLEINKIKNKIEEYEDNIEDLNNDLKDIDNKYDMLIKYYEENLKELKRCPICGNKIDNEIIQRCLNEI